MITLLLTSLQLRADANPELWPYVKERLFSDRPIAEAEFLTISGPKRVSSGAQVPVTIKLDSPDDIEMKYVFLIIDANPTQHAATYKLTNLSQELELSTRIRMETDSFVRVVAEDTAGKLYMSATADNFHVTSKLEVFEGEQRIFFRNWDFEVPRNQV